MDCGFGGGCDYHDKELIDTYDKLDRVRAGSNYCSRKPQWQIILYARGGFDSYYKFEITPSHNAELPLAIPSPNGVIPAVVGYESSSNVWVTDPENPHMDYSVAGYAGVGLEKGSIGVGVEQTSEGISPYVYAEAGDVGVSYAPGNSLEFSGGNGTFVIDISKKYERVYVLTTDMAVEEAGGYHAFGEQYVYDDNDFHYQLLAQSSDKSVLALKATYRWQLMPLVELP